MKQIPSAFVEFTGKGEPDPNPIVIIIGNIYRLFFEFLDYPLNSTHRILL